MPLRCALLAVVCLSALAQEQTGEIHGKAVNSRGNQPLALVQIQLTGTSFKTVTGDDGTFQIKGIPGGNYVLQVSTVGYYVLRQEFSLAAGEEKSFELVLTSSNERRTDTVEVSAGAFEGPTQTSAAALTLDGEERKNLASVLADDPLRAVQGLPGVSSNNDFDSEFSLRGAPFDRVGLYLDGVLLHAPFHTVDGNAENGSLTIFNGDMTDTMTLYEGAWPVRYADRTAGILAVETREGNREALQGRITASASNAGALFEGPIGQKKRGSWLVAFRKSYLQYLLNRVDFGDQAPFAFGFTDGQARLSYDLTAHHTVTLSYIDGASSVDRTAFLSELGPNSIATSGFRYSLVNFGSRYTPNQRLVINNHLAWTRERGEVANPTNSPLLRQAYGEWDWNGDATFAWGRKQTLDFGGLLRQSREDGALQLFVFTPTRTASNDLFRGTATRTGAYVQQSFAISSRMRLNLGVRGDAHSKNPIRIISPYASVSYQARERTSFHLDWGQYAQYPELNQLLSRFASALLLPERASHYEFAMEQRLDDRTRLRIELYDRQDRDLLARPLLDPRVLPNGTIFNPLPNAPWRNSQKGYARGAEIYLQRRSANGFDGWISYAYGKAIISDGDLQLKFPSDFDQRHTFNAYVGRRLRPTVNLSARFTYGSGMPFPGFYRLVGNSYFLDQNRGGVRAPAYQRTDVRLNKAYVHKKSSTTLFAEVVNLTNHKNTDFDSPGSYNSKTGQTFPTTFSMFPILPSAGVVFEF